MKKEQATLLIDCLLPVMPTLLLLPPSLIFSLPILEHTVVCEKDARDK